MRPIARREDVRCAVVVEMLIEAVSAERAMGLSTRPRLGLLEVATSASESRLAQKWQHAPTGSLCHALLVRLDDLVLRGITMLDEHG